jgi:hypothetical protein
MKKIRLRLGNNIFTNEAKYEVINVDLKYLWDEGIDCTLKDISIILNSCCGFGVLRNLAEELCCKYSNISIDDMIETLGTIISRYEKMDDEYAMIRAYDHK